MTAPSAAGAVAPMARTEPSPATRRAQFATAGLAQAISAADLDGCETMARYLLSSSGSLPAVYDVVRDTLAEVGARWSVGELDVATEHAITDVVRYLVARLRNRPAGPLRRTVILAAPDGQRHVVGMHVVAHLLEAAGFRAVVGGELPWAEIAALICRERDVVAVGLSPPLDADPTFTRRQLNRLRTVIPPTAILIGGPAADADANLWRQVGADGGVASGRETVDAVARLDNPLTAREKEVLTCVAEGLTNAGAGQRLGVGQATVKAHLDRVFVKLATPDRASAVALAIRNGWV